MGKRKGKRRANGDGAIRRRDNGTWECTLMEGYYETGPRKGSRKTQSFYGKTQAEVKQKRDLYKQGKLPCLAENQKYTVEEWLARWLEHHSKRLKPATQESYKYTSRLIVNGSLGKMLLSSVKAYDIECFLQKLQDDDYSSSMLSKVKGMLYQVFNAAEANELVSKNVVRLTEKLKKMPPKRKDAFTAEEVQILMDKLPQDKIGWSIRILLASGLRKQELLGLTKNRISPDGSSLIVDRAVTRVKGTAVIGTPKSFDSYRTVPLPPSVHKFARCLRESCADDEDLIWESPKKRGQPVNPSHFDALFREALERVEGVRVLTPHCCRHTYVSQMQALNVPLETIQSIVGHADIDMTTHYLHMQESQRQAAVNRFAETFRVQEV